MSVEFSSRAERDLRRLGRGPHRKQIRAALEALDAGEPNADVKTLTGRAPWQRLRAGDYRVLFRAAGRDDTVIWVGRIVHRRDLERAISRLDLD